MKKLILFIITIAVITCSFFVFTGCQTKINKITISADGYVCNLKSDGYSFENYNDDYYYSIKDSDGKVIAIVIDTNYSYYEEGSFYIINNKVLTIILGFEFDAYSIKAKVKNGKNCEMQNSSIQYKTITIGDDTFFGQAFTFEPREVFKDSIINISGFSDFNAANKKWRFVYEESIQGEDISYKYNNNAQFLSDYYIDTSKPAAASTQNEATLVFNSDGTVVYSGEWYEGLDKKTANYTGTYTLTDEDFFVEFEDEDITLQLEYLNDGRLQIKNSSKNSYFALDWQI